MTIIAALQEYLKTCPELADGAGVWIDHDDTGLSYSIVPAPGDRVLESYIDGGSLRQYAFAFQIATSTADDYERLKNAGFNEIFADWLEDQTLAGNLPDLGAKRTAVGIEAQNGFLFEQGDSETGIYQIMCNLTYEQEP
jgi:hypothetical protein